MSPPLCPEEESLVLVVLGDPVSAEVSAHVESCSACRQHVQRLRNEISGLRQSGLLATPVPPAGAGAAVEKPTHDVPPETVLETPHLATKGGERPAAIGKYFIVGMLERGGQASVFRGLHPTLGKDVAIKWSHQALADEPTERDHLLAEGKMLAELDHPNIVRVLDLDVHEGRPFLVVEYVRGGNLEQYVARRHPSPAQAAALLVPLAHAVALAHRRGITHQDIKPRNILMDDADNPRLTDFGIARLGHFWSQDADQPVGGTVGYMAPEQARGEEGSIGPASDIFGLGGVLCYLLTGKAPFSAANAYLAHQQAQEGRVDLTALRAAKVSRHLAAICEKALSADPARRHRNAEEFAAELERYRNRPRMLLRWAGLFALLLVLGGGAWVLKDLRPTEPASRQVSLPEWQTLIGQVERDGHLHELADALPLRNGDRFRITCQLPLGVKPALFLIDSEGKLQEVTDFEVIDNQLRYPALHRGKVPLEGPAGTELLLVCAGRTRKPTIEDLKQALPDPKLPAGTTIVLNRDRIDAKTFLGRVGAPAETRLSQLEDRLEELRRNLRNRCDFLAGLAFYHDEGS